MDQSNNLLFWESSVFTIFMIQQGWGTILAVAQPIMPKSKNTVGLWFWWFRWGSADGVRLITDNTAWIDDAWWYRFVHYHGHCSFEFFSTMVFIMSSLWCFCQQDDRRPGSDQDYLIWIRRMVCSWWYERTWVIAVACYRKWSAPFTRAAKLSLSNEGVPFTNESWNYTLHSFLPGHHLHTMRCEGNPSTQKSCRY